MARKKRAQELLHKKQMVHDAQARLSDKLDNLNVQDEAEYEDVFRSVVEKRSRIAKRQKAVLSEQREIVEFN